MLKTVEKDDYIHVISIPCWVGCQVVDIRWERNGRQNCCLDTYITFSSSFIKWISVDQYNRFVELLYCYNSCSQAILSNPLLFAEIQRWGEVTRKFYSGNQKNFNTFFHLLERIESKLNNVRRRFNVESTFKFV